MGDIRNTLKCPISPHLMKKALVLYSGGLDSRLVVRMLQDQGYEIEALHFNLPFGCGCCNLSCNSHFTQKEKIKLKILDVTKGELLKEYLAILKNPKHGTGKGINPCKDCKIFMFKKAKEYADKVGVDVVATGEVVGQRPMSQVKSAMAIIDKEIGFEIRRPLMEMGMSGRNRKPQMALASKFGIKYPTPGGGCFLCEKVTAKRFKHLIKNDLINEETLPLTLIGRHFFIKGVWFVVARNEKECELINKFKTSVSDRKTAPAIFYSNEKGKQKALELREAYASGTTKKMREKFKEVKL